MFNLRVINFQFKDVAYPSTPKAIGVGYQANVEAQTDKEIEEWQRHIEILILFLLRKGCQHCWILNLF